MTIYCLRFSLPAAARWASKTVCNSAEPVALRSSRILTPWNGGSKRAFSRVVHKKASETFPEGFWVFHALDKDELKEQV